MTDPRILFWDTEYTPALTYSWNNRPKFLSNDFLVEPARMLCFGARWYGSKKTEVVDERDGRKEMLLRIRDILTEADMVVSYNGIGYDSKKVKGEFLKEGIDPPAPYKEIDLFRVVKSQASFYSHKLDYIAQEMGVGKKVDTGGFQLWLDVMAGDEKAWRKMRRYQKQDVDLLVDLFERLKPWIKMPVPISENPESCHNCGGDEFQSRGWAYAQYSKYRRFQCKKCKSWLRGTTRHATTDLRKA